MAPLRRGDEVELRRLLVRAAIHPVLLVVAAAGVLASLALLLRRQVSSMDPALLAVASTAALALVLAALLPAVVLGRTRRITRAYQRALLEAAARADDLAESEERFRLFVEGVRDAAIYMLDPEGHVRSWNVGAQRMKGYLPEEIVGRHFSLFYTAEDVADDLPRRELAEAASAGRVEGEGWRVRRDGSRFWASVTLRALRGGEGRVVGYAKLVRDTTERKRGEMRRSAQYEVARALSEAESVAGAMPALLAGVGAALGYDAALAWVPAGDRIQVAATWHRPSSRAAGFLELVRPTRLERGEGLVGHAWSSGAPSWVEDVRDDLGRERAPEAMEAGLLSIVTFPVLASGEVRLVVQLLAGDSRRRDADLMQLCATLAVQVGAYLERHLAEEEAREAQRRRGDELERRVRERTEELTVVNRELEAFGYSVSHDLRAPLRALDGFSRALLEDHAAGLDSPGRDYLARIRAASQRMERLIDDLLQLSRLARSELKVERVDLSELFRAVAAEVQEREPSRRVEVLVQGGVFASGDARLLRVGLTNVVDNAFKFTRRQASPRVEFGMREEAGRRAYYVRDNGAGFDMAYAGKLFQPFQRLHGQAEFEGSGIGLATWQRIVHRHGGRVWAEGEPGKGAAFHFTLGDHPASR